ncbi:MAG: hypothetical protein J1D88_03265 [Treponema sp.]|nr:hypothetical protein [Treponema sp.]
MARLILTSSLMRKLGYLLPFHIPLRNGVSSDEKVSTFSSLEVLEKVCPLGCNTLQEQHSRQTQKVPYITYYCSVIKFQKNHTRLMRRGC